MNYNLQPYGKDGDTTGKRNLKWFEKYILPRIGSDKDLMVVELGCGNGRFLPYLAERYKGVMGLDPVCKLDARFKKKGVWFESFEIGEQTGWWTPLMFMFGSFYIIRKNVGKRIFDILDQQYKDMSIVGFGSEIDMVKHYGEEMKEHGFELEKLDDGFSTYIFRRNY